jgi:hypothetical protein
MSDETRLEDTFRAGLQRRADDVDPTADLLGPARSAARGRRRRTRVAGSVGLAAAALVAAAVVQTVGDEPDRGTQVAETPTEPLPAEWRREAWHGLQVEVPADWAWGGAPDACGVGPAVGADGARDLDRETTPYVGRPVPNTDDCGGVAESPKADSAWLGSNWGIGVEDLPGGYVRTTVAVRGTRLTVTTDDPRLSRHILESATSPEGCEPSLDSAPTVDSMLIEGLRDPSSAQVCAYRREQGASSWDLLYATTLGEKEAAAYHSQVYDGGVESSPEFCAEGYDERVLITITGDDPYGGPELTQATVVDPACRQVQGSPGMVTPLSDAGMDAWTKNGLPATLYALIGPMG